MAKYKGVSYIAQKLAKNFPNKFTGYKAALPQARLVFAQIQDAGEKVTVVNIKSKIVKPRRKIKGAPVLPPAMTEPINYFDMNSYIELISKLPDNILFKSKLIPSTVAQPLVGGGNYSYEELFKPYVDYINTIKNLTPEDDDRYESDWYVMCTMPVPDKKKKGMWISNIISTDSRGDEFDYGFNPKKPNEEAKEVILSGNEAQEQLPDRELPDDTDVRERAPAAPSAAADDRTFLLEMEKQREKTATAIRDAAKAKMDLITMLKEMGFTPAEIKAELNKL